MNSRRFELDPIGTERVRPLPPFPTNALPGSDEKIEVMRWRHSQGYQLHHPQDLRLSSRARVEVLEHRLLDLVQMLREATMHSRGPNLRVGAGRGIKDA